MKVERLKKRRQFLALGNDCKRHVLPAMIVLSSNAPEIGKVHVGFTASKKVGNAVARALAKRRMRAVVDEVMRLNSSFASSGLSLNIIARAYISNRDFAKMVREFKALLEADLKCTF
ncbi:MAG: ribonuclease P protein component [Alphaproteobacteria bacterium]|jgi:ribonuclease P protein component